LRLWNGKRPVYLMSKHDVASDPSWEALIKRGVKLLDTESLRTAPVDVARDFGADGALLVFDDLLDAYSHDKKMEAAILGLVSDAIDLGRRHKLSVIAINHELTSWKRTRSILHSAHWVVTFPSLTPAHSLRYLLKKLGYDAAAVAEYRRMGRWVALSVCAPQVVLSASEARLALD